MSVFEAFVNRCLENRWWDISMVKAGMDPEEYRKIGVTFQHQSKWELIDQALYHGQCVKRKRTDYMREFYKVDEENAKLWQEYFELQDLDVAQLKRVIIGWLDASYGRKNVLRLLGPISTGKSLIANTLGSMFLTCYMGCDTRGGFFYGNCVNKALIVWEECFLDTGVAQDAKKLFSGDALSVEVKYKAQQVVPRTPILVTSNRSDFGLGFLKQQDEVALADRCIDVPITRRFRSRAHMTADGFCTFLFQ